MPDAASRIVAWGAFATSCVLVVVGVAVRGVGAASFGEDAVLALAFTLIGALVLSREPGNRAGWICLTAVLAALAYGAQAYGDGTRPGGAFVSWLAAWVWIPGLLPVLTLLLLFLPDGRLPGPRWRPVAWSVAAVIGALTMGLASAAALRLPGPEDTAASGSPIDLLLVALVLACAGVCLSGLVVRMRRARTAERAQLLWIVLGAAVFVLGATLNFGLPTPWPSVIAQGSALALPVGVKVAMLRHRLFDLNPLLRRLVLALTLSVLLLGLFLALRALLGDSTPAAAAVTLVLALGTPALARWLGGGVDRVVYGRRGDPAASLAALGRELGAAVEPEEVLGALVEVTIGSLQADGARVVLTSGGGELLRTSRGDPAGVPNHSAELRWSGTHLGRLEVSSGDGLDEADRALLDDLAAAAAPAVAVAHRSLELRRSRELLVIAREQERRKIARDLHDGVGPVLSGLGFTLDALRANLRDGSSEEVVAARAGAQVREAVVLVRGLSRGLRPAGLDQLGLRGALAELVAHHTTTDLAVHLEQPDRHPPVAAATEVALYAIVAEAVTNVARHARATCCRIAVRLDGPEVEVTVSDDGIGLRGAAPGVGRSSMIERAAELGGRCTVADIAPHGTRVTALLPHIGTIT